MRQFLELANRFRSTPIVDDDFPYIRHRFDKALDRLTEALPTIVCLCGSTRFASAFQNALLEETLAGRIVLTVGCVTSSDYDLKASPLMPSFHRRTSGECRGCLIE